MQSRRRAGTLPGCPWVNLLGASTFRAPHPSICRPEMQALELNGVGGNREVALVSGRQCRPPSAPAAATHLPLCAHCCLANS